MSWLAIVLWLITNIPEIVKLVQELIDLIKHIPHPQQLGYRDAISNAILSGDKENVKKVVQECVGLACPSDLKKE